MRLVLVLMFGLSTAACGLTLGVDPPAQDGSLLDSSTSDGGTDDSTVGDGDPGDSAPFDTSIDAGCSPGDERCDGLDNDCDFLVDEGFDIQMDPRNCGACGNVCPSRTGDVTTCEMGECKYGCLPGYYDCNGDELDGCEAVLGSSEHCTSCFDACDPDQVCEADGCGSECGKGLTECNLSCVDTNTSLVHCGSCGTSCTAGLDVPICNDGRCEIGVCRPGHLDCNRDMSDGCEIDGNSDRNYCGSCTNRCDGGETCRSGVCSPITPACTSLAEWGAFGMAGSSCTGTCGWYTLNCTGTYCECANASGGSLRCVGYTTCPEAAVSGCCAAIPGS